MPKNAPNHFPTGSGCLKLEEVLFNVEQLTNLRAETQDKYTADLKQLCGTRIANPDNPSEGTVPDILTYLAPP